jgi:5-methyltetrahydrofolate corrinoid/iron sulfur protein methyltransferase
MQVIGERLNGMFTDVGKAIVAQDKSVIHDTAKRQLEAGADILDLNVGPTAEDALAAMKWLVETTREVTDAPLAIDSTKIAVIEAGIALAGSTGMINSSKGDEESLDRFMPLAAQYSCDIVCLTIDKAGIPRDANGRMEIAMRIVEKAMMNGVDLQRVYIDPVIIPCNVPDAGHHPGEVLETIRQVKLIADPPPKTTLGLSNVSQGTSARALINRTYLVMCLAAGLDSAIMDPLDTELMDAMITGELLLNRAIYCDDFRGAYRKSKAR